MKRLSRLSKFQYFIGAGVLLLALIYSIFFREYNFISREQASLAAIIVGLGVLPSYIALVNKREFGLIPLMPLHGIFYAFTYGIPTFSNQTEWLNLPEDVISEALVLTIVGLLSLYLGYYSSRKLLRRIATIPTRTIESNQLTRLAWILFISYLAFLFFPNLRSLPSVGQLVAPLGYMSLGILAVLSFKGLLSRFQRFLFIVATALTILILILTGSLAPAVFFLVFLGILFWNVKRRLPWVFIFILLVITVFLNPIKMKYRDLTWGEVQGTLSVYDRANKMFDVVQEVYGVGDVASVLDDDSSTINRLSHISTFGHVLYLTPDSVPYWMGDSYKTLWTSFIPRVFWPGKPEATIGQDFGHRYYLISDSNFTTSVNLPWLVEFYANFGLFGVIFGMFFVGVIFRFLVKKFSVLDGSVGEHVLGVTIMFNLFYAESNFSLMIGGLLLTSLVFILILRLTLKQNFKLTKS